VPPFTPWWEKEKKRKTKAIKSARPLPRRPLAFCAHRKKREVKKVSLSNNTNGSYLPLRQEYRRKREGSAAAFFFSLYRFWLGLQRKGKGGKGATSHSLAQGKRCSSPSGWGEGRGKVVYASLLPFSTGLLGKEEGKKRRGRRLKLQGGRGTHYQLSQREKREETQGLSSSRRVLTKRERKGMFGPGGHAISFLRGKPTYGGP